MMSLTESTPKYRQHRINSTVVPHREKPNIVAIVKENLAVGGGVTAKRRAASLLRKMTRMESIFAS